MVDIFHGHATLWISLHRAADKAPPATDIPRIPLIPGDIHETVWAVHTRGRHVALHTSYERLKETARLAPSGAVGKLIRWPNDWAWNISSDLMNLRSLVRRILGLPRW